MAIREILQLGNPELYLPAEEVLQEEGEDIIRVVEDLHDTMMSFRNKYKAGRAIAAPQIGFRKRLIYMHITGPVVFINPVLKDKSEEMLEIWDDCMCFPDLLVKVLRHKSCRIVYRDKDWQEQTMFLEDDLSELLQHEYDHLDGILAVSRAYGANPFALTSQRALLSGRQIEKTV